MAQTFTPAPPRPCVNCANPFECPLGTLPCVQARERAAAADAQQPAHVPPPVNRDCAFAAAPSQEAAGEPSCANCSEPKKCKSLSAVCFGHRARAFATTPAPAAEPRKPVLVRNEAVTIRRVGNGFVVEARASRGTESTLVFQDLGRHADGAWDASLLAFLRSHFDAPEDAA